MSSTHTLMRLSDLKTGACIIYRFDPEIGKEAAEQLLQLGVVEKLPAIVVSNVPEGVVLRTDGNEEAEIGEELASHIWVIPEGSAF